MLIYEMMDMLPIVVFLRVTTISIITISIITVTTISIITVVSIPVAAVVFIMDVIMRSDPWSCVEVIVVSYWNSIWSVMSIFVVVVAISVAVGMGLATL